MNIETRLRKLESSAADSLPNAADKAYHDYLAALIVICYDTNEGDERDARIAALGPRPIATTPRTIKFERDLAMAYGDSVLMPVERNG